GWPAGAQPLSLKEEELRSRRNGGPPAAEAASLGEGELCPPRSGGPPKARRRGVAARRGSAGGHEGLWVVSRGAIGRRRSDWSDWAWWWAIQAAMSGLVDQR